MKLNCRPGDLAVIVKSSCGNEGRIVEILHFIGTMPDWEGINRWKVAASPPLRSLLGCAAYTVQDANMRPLRDTPGDDETLSWCDVPEGVTA